jgi:hypothetical protein
LPLNTRCYTRLIEIPHKHWADYAFPAPRYGQRTSNLVEQQNHVYLQPREMPILDMCTAIWKDIQRKVFDRLQAAQVARGPFSEHINTLYQLDDHSSRSFEAIPSSQSLGLVHSRRDINKEFRVQLNPSGGSCSCMAFQNGKRPCVHALALIHELRLAPIDYIAPFHRLQAWQSTYLLPLPPILRSTLVGSPEILPPARKQKRGRPKKKRMESGRGGLRTEIVEEGGNGSEDQSNTPASQPQSKAPVESQPLSLATAFQPALQQRRKPHWVYVVDVPQEVQQIASRTRSGKL